MEFDPEENRRGWAERSGAYSPRYYAELGPNEVTETLLAALEHYVPTDARVLELGCSSGRHLAALLDAGYENLAGVDLNPDAFEVMTEYHPALAATGAFHVGAIEDVVPGFENDAFDVVYSVETLQHVHPDDEWVFEALTDLTTDLLITAENEGNSPRRGRGEHAVSRVEGDPDEEFPLYHRDWKAVFTGLGMAQLLVESGKRDTVRVFRRP
jgi:SAM-dependent methyltransferase